MRITRLIGLAAALAPLPALAQEAAAPNPLAGPSVHAPAAAATLVERDFEGKLRRLEAPPEEAALALLELTETERAACRTILDERAAILDKIVGGNIELLVEVNSAAQSGDKAGLLRLAGRVNRELEPLRRRGSLVNELASALAEENATKLRDLARTYRMALRDEVVAEAKAKGQKLRPRQGMGRVALLELGQEIRRSYERQIDAGTAQLETLIARLGLTPEQDGKFRNMVAQFFQETKGQPTPAQKRQFFFRVMGILDAGQKKELLRYAVQRP